MTHETKGRAGRKPSTKYPALVRDEAARLARAGQNATAIGRALGVPPSTVQVWIAPILEAHGRAAVRLQTALTFKACVADRLAERDARNILVRHEPDIYVDVLGDPPPGRSALDRIRAEGRGLERLK